MRTINFLKHFLNFTHLVSFNQKTQKFRLKITVKRLVLVRWYPNRDTI